MGNYLVMRRDGMAPEPQWSPGSRWSGGGGWGGRVNEFVGIGELLGLHPRNLRQEIIHALIVLVDAGEAQIGHGIKFAEGLRIATPTSSEQTSACPVARTVSSTVCPSRASCLSVTGRPLQAFRTPLITLSRLKAPPHRPSSPP